MNYEDTTCSAWFEDVIPLDDENHIEVWFEAYLYGNIEGIEDYRLEQYVVDNSDGHEVDWDKEDVLDSIDYYIYNVLDPHKIRWMLPEED